MRITTLDCETTIFEKGNPFARRNRLCMVGLGSNTGVYHSLDIEYGNNPYGYNLEVIAKILEDTDLLVGFNLKFDLHWIRRYIPDVKIPIRVWDCQLAEFILSNQTWAYPSLDESLRKRGFEPKLDVVKKEYWEKGIDTPDVPRDILEPYLRRDVEGTYELYQAQLKEITQNRPEIFTLFKAQCVDLLVLQEMEFNGMLYDVPESERLGLEAESKLVQLDAELDSLANVSGLNWNSSDHISCVLFGGTIPLKARVETQRILKDGTVKIGEKWGVVPLVCPRLAEPRRGTETEKEGIWSVGESLLRNLKGSKRVKSIVALLLERARLSKLQTTYYNGLPKIIDQKDWNSGTIYGSFNQCRASTGRIASSGPNLQNFSGEIKQLFHSRFGEL